MITQTPSAKRLTAADVAVLAGHLTNDRAPAGHVATVAAAKPGPLLRPSFGPFTSADLEQLMDRQRIDPREIVMAPRTYQQFIDSCRCSAFFFTQPTAEPRFDDRVLFRESVVTWDADLDQDTINFLD